MIKEQIVLFRRMSRLAALRKGRWLALFVLANATGLLALVNPYLSKLAVDEGILGSDLVRFFKIALMGAGVFVLSQALRSAHEYLMDYMRAKVHFEISRRFYRRIIKLPVAWFKDRSTGEHIYKIDYDVATAADFTVQAFPAAATIVLRFVATFAILFFLSPWVAFLALALAPMFYAVSRYGGCFLEKITEVFVEASEAVVRYLEEHFSRVFLIKGFGREQSSLRGYVQKIASAFRARMALSRVEIRNGLLNEASAKMATGAVVFYGGYLVIRGHLTLGSLTAALAYLYQLVGLYQEAVIFYQNSVAGFVSGKRLLEVMDTPAEVFSGVRDFEFVRGKEAVAFEEVCFGYQKEALIFNNISFVIGAGQHVALAGPSGCGKSTLLSLLLRFYEPRQGTVRVGGCDARDLDIGRLRQDLGFAFQQTFLWNDAIGNNIRYGNPAATRRDVEEAACLSGADEFIRRIPGGYEARIGENACKLSEGQKQKIAIARALVKKPKILILDEAMASMDSQSEEQILVNIKEHCSPLTLIVVSHRLSAVRAADLAVYLVSPNEVLVDTPDRFLQHNDSFIKLFSGQTRGGAL